MEKVHIIKVKTDDTDKQGNKLISKKSGKPYYKVGIQTQEHGQTWLNGLMPFSPDRWENTEQELEIYDEEYQGKTYKKFKLPPRKDSGPAANNAGTAEIKNILMLKVIPMLNAIHDEIKIKTDNSDFESPTF